MSAAVAWLLTCSFKAALLLAASSLGAALIRRGTAAARHQMWTLGVVGALLLPLLCWVLPSLSLTTHAPIIGSTSSLVASAVFVTAGPASTPAWPTWLAIAWVLGTAIVALRLLRGHLAARRLVHSAESPVVASWSVALADAMASLGLTKPVELLRSESIGSPMTIGIVRPRVVLPATADAWSPVRLRAVLIHELGHVRRHDTMIQLAAQIGCALYWWNPLAWLAATRLRVEREHACDDLVIGAGILPSSYASDLLDVARSISHAHTGAICMVDHAGTDARLRRILDATAPRRPTRARFTFAVRGVTLGCAVMLACTSSPPPPATRGTLSVGAPFVRDPSGPDYPPSLRAPNTLGPSSQQGAIALPVVTAEITRRLGRLAACYERRLAVSPALSGMIEIHWVIAENGDVPESCITKDTVGDRELVDCVNQLVREGGRFPAPRGGSVDVSFPFVFNPRNSHVAAAL